MQRHEVGVIRHFSRCDGGGGGVVQLVATLDCNDDHEMIDVEEFESVLKRHMEK